MMLGAPELRLPCLPCYTLNGQKVQIRAFPSPTLQKLPGSFRAQDMNCRPFLPASRGSMSSQGGLRETEGSGYPQDL